MESLGSKILKQNAYILMLILTVFAGFINGRLKTKPTRQWFLTITGFSSVILFCGYDALYSAAAIFGGAIIIKYLGGSDHPRVVFVFSFLYRYLFNAVPYIGLPRNENNLANAVQLLVTLKIISVAYEINSYRIKSKLHENVNGSSLSNGELKQNNRHEPMTLLEEPTFFDIISYMYCFIGLATGPFFQYRTYYDMLHMPPSVSRQVPVLLHMRSKFPTIVTLVTVMLSLDQLFPFRVVKEDMFYTDSTFWYRLCYTMPLGISVLCKYSVVWAVSELAFAAAKLGVYPSYLNPVAGQGPTEFTKNEVWDEKTEIKDWSFATTQNMFPWKIFILPTCGESYKYWNCSVNWWLARYVYANDVIPRRMKIIRLLNVSIICSTWHGFGAGYYFSLLCLPVVVFAEQSAKTLFGRIFQRDFKKVFVLLSWLTFKLMGMTTFMTVYHLTFHQIIRYLSSVYFSIYTISLALLFFNLLISYLPKKKN